jgi:hypothetical protein
MNVGVLMGVGTVCQCEGDDVVGPVDVEQRVREQQKQLLHDEVQKHDQRQMPTRVATAPPNFAAACALYPEVRAERGGMRRRRLRAKKR